jgi:hypothetical protein
LPRRHQVARTEEPTIPYPDAVEAAVVSMDRLDSIRDYGLLVGNGDCGSADVAGGRLVFRAVSVVK